MSIPKMYDLTGKRFDKLVVIQYDHSDKRGRYWLCKCDCGNTKVVNGSYVNYPRLTPSAFEVGA